MSLSRGSGSALGAALAARDKGSNRVVLFVGEGSLCVEPPILPVVCN